MNSEPNNERNRLLSTKAGIAIIALTLGLAGCGKSQEQNETVTVDIQSLAEKFNSREVPFFDTTLIIEYGGNTIQDHLLPKELRRQIKAINQAAIVAIDKANSNNQEEPNVDLRSWTYEVASSDDTSTVSINNESFGTSITYPLSWNDITQIDSAEFIAKLVPSDISIVDLNSAEPQEPFLRISYDKTISGVYDGPEKIANLPADTLKTVFDTLSTVLPKSNKTSMPEPAPTPERSTPPDRTPKLCTLDKRQQPMTPQIPLDRPLACTLPNEKPEQCTPPNGMAEPMRGSARQLPMIPCAQPNEEPEPSPSPYAVEPFMRVPNSLL